MKKFLIGSLLIFSIINVQAQWYHKYGANDINYLSEAQLNLALQNSEKKIKTGKILTFAGIGSTVLGGILFADAIDKAGESWDSYWNSMGELGGGLLLMTAGAGMIVIGIPIWIVGVNRRNSIEIVLTKFNSSSFLGFNKPAGFGYKPPTAIGLSLKFNF